MKPLRTNPFRLATQILIAAVLLIAVLRLIFDKSSSPDFEAYCPLGGVQALTDYLVNKTLPCSMATVQIAIGIGLILAIVLLSKLFCSYVCPVGFLSEWLGKAGNRLKVRFTFHGWTDKVLRILKYGLLFVTFYFTMVSSELFCKWFCPYFAVVSGFNSDVNVILASISIGIVIVGSLFSRLFWCRYVCPLGALSNVFRFFILFASTLLIFLLIRLAGWKMSFIWPLAFLCLVAYLCEIFNLGSRFFPILKILRNPDVCTNCKLCSKHCPFAIDVSSQTEIRDIDCHLCADCLQVCPEKNALTIGRSGRKWLPVLVLVIMVATCIIAGKKFEIPTLSQYWAAEETKKDMQVFSLSGLNSVTCYGSAVVFSNHMYNLDGVYGIAAYVRRHEVKVWYDKDYTDTVKIKEWIFTPVKIEIRKLNQDSKHVHVIRLRVDNFLDPGDSERLASLLSVNPEIIGFTTEFACPVKITLYTSNEGKDLNNRILNLITQKQAGSSRMFKVTEINLDLKSIEPSEYQYIMLTTY